MQIKRVLFASLFTMTSAAFAQAPGAAAPAAGQPTADEAQRNQQMEQAALQVAQLVDRNQSAQVWDGASVVAKSVVSRDAFIKAIQADRQAVGAPVARNLASLSFTQSDGKKLPAGVFANIAFATRFANEKAPVRELVSFHLDNDHVWRVSGYTLR